MPAKNAPMLSRVSVQLVSSQCPASFVVGTEEEPLRGGALLPLAGNQLNDQLPRQTCGLYLSAIPDASALSQTHVTEPPLFVIVKITCLPPRGWETEPAALNNTSTVQPSWVAAAHVPPVVADRTYLPA